MCKMLSYQCQLELYKITTIICNGFYHVLTKIKKLKCTELSFRSVYCPLSLTLILPLRILQKIDGEKEPSSFDVSYKVYR